MAASEGRSAAKQGVAAPLDGILSQLEELAAHFAGSVEHDLAQATALLRRRGTLIEALRDQLREARPAPAEEERVRVQLAAGHHLAALLEQTAGECRAQLRDLFRESIVNQALAPAATSGPCEIDCRG